MSAADIAAGNLAFEKAVHAGDLNTIASLYLPDAVLLPPDSQIVRGREAIGALWASAVKEHGLTSVRIQPVDLDISGDTACEVGHASLGMTLLDGKTETTDVKYLAIWKLHDGKWLLHRDMWNNRG